MLNYDILLLSEAFSSYEVTLACLKMHVLRSQIRIHLAHVILIKETLEIACSPKECHGLSIKIMFILYLVNDLNVCTSLLYYTTPYIDRFWPSSASLCHFSFFFCQALFPKPLVVFKVLWPTDMSQTQ